MPPTSAAPQAYTPTPEQRNLIDCLGRFAPRLRRMLRALGFPRGVIEEAVSEAVCAALGWVRDGRVATIRHRRAYLRRTAFRIAVAIAGRLRDAVSLGEVPEPVAPSREGAGDSWTALAGELMSALDGLTRRRREAIELRFLGGLSYREAAEEMGCNRSSVRALEKAGLAALRRALEGRVPPGLLRKDGIAHTPAL